MAHHVFMFASRNKDNRDIPGFKERRKLYMESEKLVAKLPELFQQFVKNGLDGELCRAYVSVNDRDIEKAKKLFLSKLIMQDGVPENLQNDFISAAMKAECAAEKKWMFDFDSMDAGFMGGFLADIVNDMGAVAIDVHETPHGFAIIVPHGFDTRKLMEKWGDFVELKRDDLLCYDWKVAGGSQNEIV